MVLFHAGRPSSARHGRNHYADYEYGSAQRLLVHFYYLQLTMVVQILTVTVTLAMSALGR